MQISSAKGGGSFNIMISNEYHKTKILKKGKPMCGAFLIFSH